MIDPNPPLRLIPRWNHGTRFRLIPRWIRLGLDNLDLGGYKVGFKPGVRSGSRFVELTIVTEAGRIRQ